MTPLSRALALFPAVVLGCAALALLWLVSSPGPAPGLALVASLYGLPLAAFHLHQRFHPVQPGVSRLDRPVYDPWWGSHQIQWVYLAFPALEAALRAVPGLFSLWLRAWGSEVGARVYWTPRLEIADRSLLVVGDGVLFGQGARLTAHVIKPTRDGGLLCVVRPVRIGDGAFIGAEAVLGPGTTVAPGALVPAGSAHLGRGGRP